MAAKWRASTVAKEVDLLFGFAFKSAEFATEPPGFRLVRGDNVKRGVLEWGEKTRYWQSVTPDLERYSLRVGDIVVGMDGSRVGENFARISSEDIPALLVQRVACLRARGDLDQEFLRYLICNPSFTSYVKAVHTGTSIPHISGGQIGSFPIWVPPIDEQRAIAHILKTLDDKIELNRRMAATLEEMARAIFKSWFIDFDPVRAKSEGRPTGLPAEIGALFPDAFQDSALGEVPCGWTLRSLDAVGDFLNGLALQKFPAIEGQPWLPVIKIAQLRKGITPDCDRASLGVPPSYVIEDGDLLFSWSGSLEVKVWSHGKGALNQHLFKVSSERTPQWFLYHALLCHLPEFRRIAAAKATTMGHIQRSHISAALCALPPDGLLSAIDKVLCPLHQRSLVAQLEIRALERLREELLPRLLSEGLPELSQLSQPDESH